MGYLVCDKCGGYYELQKGESSDTFDENCKCGGKLGYVDNLDEEIEVSNTKESDILFKKYIFPPTLLIMGSAICVCLGILYNVSATIFLGFIGVILGLIFLIIRIMGLESTFDVKYMQLVYFLSAIQFLIISYILIINWIQIDNSFRAKIILPIFIILSIIACLSMISKTVYPDNPQNLLNQPV